MEQLFIIAIDFYTQMAYTIRKTGRSTMSRLFTIVIQKEDFWYVAKCLENNVASQGETMDEAIINLREALELYYEDEVLPTLPQTFVTTLEVAI